ncbi:uncharacterized protein [Ptychodera flava]|uniref:uncharacterized protein isoform X1 n=1 Tax=Ptychodera flava TaxID=63121 RepID=UPI00396A7073
MWLLPGVYCKDDKYVDDLDRKFLREMATLLRDNEYALVVQKLGIGEDERKRIETKYFPEQEQRYQMLLLWKRKSKEKGTADRLLKALHAADVAEVDAKTTEARLKTLTAPEIHTTDAEDLSDDNLFSISTLLDPKYYFSLGGKLGISNATLLKLEQSPAITANYKMMALLQCWRDTSDTYLKLKTRTLERALHDLRLPNVANEIGKVFKAQSGSPQLLKRDAGSPTEQLL